MQLSNKRKVTIAEFKGKCLVGIREYYEKDGKELPGKKVRPPRRRFAYRHASPLTQVPQGISLSLEQYNELLAIIPAINDALSKAGHEVGQVRASAAAPEKRAPKPKPPPRKSNIEQTSDEDEG